MAYNSTIDKATDDILIYGNTAKDGSGTSYVPLLDTDGHLQIDVLSSALPTGAATSAKQDTEITALQLIDDVVHSEGGVLSKFVTLGAQLDDTATTTASENAVSALRITAQRGLHINLRDNSGAELGVSGNEMYVRGTVNIGNSPLVDTELPSSATLADDTANPNTTSVGSFPHWYDGSTWDRARGTSADGLLVNLGANNDVTNAGTFAVQVDGNALTALQLIDDPVFADDAGFTVGTSKVMMTGKVAVVQGTNPDAADANDAVAGIANRHRVPYMIGGHPNIINKHIQITDADGAQTNTAVITVGAGAKIVVTRYSVTVDSATTATGGVAVRMGFGTANTPSNDANTGMLMAHSGIPAGGGIAEGDGSGIIGMGADNEDLRLTCEDPTGGNIDIVVSYYTIES